jgi:hypothetical protein
MRWLLVSVALVLGCGETDGSSALRGTPAEGTDADAPSNDDDREADDSSDDDSVDDDETPSLIDTVTDPLPTPEPSPPAEPSEPDASEPEPSEPAEPPASDPGPSEPAPPSEPVASLPLPLRYLRAEPDSRLVVEIDSVPGMEPRGGSEVDFIERFTPLLDKPDGIEMKHDDAIESRGADYVWSDAEMRELTNDVFDDDEPAGTVSVHVMFLDGSYQSPDGGVVLGVAWANRYIAMFSDVINDSCAGLPGLLGGLEQDACQTAEFGIWSHEMGHVLGLVNNGIEMQRDYEDSEHPHHDMTEGCLMYWAYDGPSFVDATFERLSNGRADIDFCEDALNDMTAARGG